jgi:hypothetical protein
MHAIPSRPSPLRIFRFIPRSKYPHRPDDVVAAETSSASLRGQLPVLNNDRFLSAGLAMTHTRPNRYLGSPQWGHARAATDKGGQSALLLSAEAGSQQTFGRVCLERHRGTAPALQEEAGVWLPRGVGVPRADGAGANSRLRLIRWVDGSARTRCRTESARMKQPLPAGPDDAVRPWPRCAETPQRRSSRGELMI